MATLQNVVKLRGADWESGTVIAPYSFLRARKLVYD
jgi:hypothetical protein